MIPLPPRSTLFPYTTLFRSVAQVFKSETVKYRTIEVAPNREEIRVDVQRTLDAQLEEYGINVTDFLIEDLEDRKSTRLNSSHANISYAVFCLKKKQTQVQTP